MGDSPCFSPRRPCHRRTFPLAVSSTFTRRGRLRGVPSLVARPSRRAFRTSPSNPGMVRKRRLVTSSNSISSGTPESTTLCWRASTSFSLRTICRTWSASAKLAVIFPGFSFVTELVLCNHQRFFCLGFLC